MDRWDWIFAALTVAAPVAFVWGLSKFFDD